MSVKGSALMVQCPFKILHGCKIFLEFYVIAQMEEARSSLYRSKTLLGCFSVVCDL